MEKIKKSIALLILVLAVHFSFQNCAKVNFLKDEASNGGQSCDFVTTAGQCVVCPPGSVPNPVAQTCILTTTTTVPGFNPCLYTDFDATKIMASRISAGGPVININSIVRGDRIYFWSAIAEAGQSYQWSISTPGNMPASFTTPSVTVNFPISGLYNVSLAIKRVACPLYSPTYSRQVLIASTTTSTTTTIPGTTTTSTTTTVPATTTTTTTTIPATTTTTIYIPPPTTSSPPTTVACNNPPGHVLCWERYHYDAAVAGNCLPVAAVSTYYTVYIYPGGSMTPAQYRAANPSMCVGYTP